MQLLLNKQLYLIPLKGRNCGLSHIHAVVYAINSKHVCTKNMRYYLFLCLCTLLLVSCRKENKPPEIPASPTDISYHNLKDTVLKWGADPIAYDLDLNQRFDLVFYTELVGDFINKTDKRKYLVLSSITTLLPVNPDETVPALQKNTSIGATLTGHEWYAFSEVALMERHEHESGTIQWFGNWLNQSKKYLPFQLVKAQQVHYGWVEISTNIYNGTITLHRAAWRTTPNQPLLAGQ